MATEQLAIPSQVRPFRPLLVTAMGAICPSVCSDPVSVKKTMWKRHKDPKKAKISWIVSDQNGADCAAGPFPVAVTWSADQPLPSHPMRAPSSEDDQPCSFPLVQGRSAGTEVELHPYLPLPALLVTSLASCQSTTDTSPACLLLGKRRASPKRPTGWSTLPTIPPVPPAPKYTPY